MRFGRIGEFSTLEHLSGAVRDGFAAIQRGFFNQHTAEGKHVFPVGTWTPEDVSGAGLAFTYRDTTWVRVGQLVFLTFRITFPTTVNASENAIGGLPFTCFQTLENTPYSNALGITTDSTNGNSINVGAGTKVMVVTNFAGSGATNAQLSTDTIQGTLIYRTSEP